MKQRLLYIDNLKGFLILLVVLGHCIQTTDTDFDHNLVFRYIYSFHMPLFMAVSGFVSYKPLMQWHTVGRRFMQLMIPFLSWTVVGACIHGDVSRLWGVLLHPDTGLWFLWALFFIVLILKICDAVSVKTRLKLEYVAVAVCLVMIGTMVTLNLKLFGFQFIAWYFSFYCIGYFGKKYEYRLAEPLRSAAVITTILFLVMACFWMRKEPPTFMSAGSSSVFCYAWKFFTAVVAIASFYSAFKCCLNRKALVLSEMGGGNTWYICYTPGSYNGYYKPYVPIHSKRMGIHRIFDIAVDFRDIH